MLHFPATTQSCMTPSALGWDYHKPWAMHIHSRKRKAPATRGHTHTLEFHCPIVFIDAGWCDKLNIEGGRWGCRQWWGWQWCWWDARSSCARCLWCAKDSHVPPTPPLSVVLCQLDTAICALAWQRLPVVKFTFLHNSHSFPFVPSRECVKVLQSKKSLEDAWEWAQQFVIPKLYPKQSVFY